MGFAHAGLHCPQAKADKKDGADDNGTKGKKDALKEFHNISGCLKNKIIMIQKIQAA
ncbi:hypothetical protein [Kingella negevensis]|uniref:hypothetical protein n=1 Tax=Kingella negevensis TaxID=1522312 RepID=UPI002551A24A|nr:hypothetical protein [Kingella negevensis]MDK4679790.1 hypothetical protein [Kingella negevensis]MDK4682491.1 hypothetical protein [Kingella negevensis]MDK4690687.1 hypothetical protein [Kingella negevensis]MDK4694165.1 hypothetical protein [Kingella negevensis]MDK4699894.1 hypothetical protein [Kingella negevensis]